MTPDGCDDGNMDADNRHDVWDLTVPGVVDRILLSLTRRDIALEGLNEAAASAALAMNELAVEMQVSNLAEDIEFAGLEDQFWSSYAGPEEPA